MDALILATGIVLLVSSICSLLEATLYALPASQVEWMAGKNQFAGKVLQKLYRDIDRPIAAILALNTLANTGGAAIAGAAFVRTFPHIAEFYFTIGISLGVLVFAEIIPKTTGVVYARTLGEFVARPIQWLVWFFTPLIWLNQLLTRLITRGAAAAPTLSVEEIKITARMGRRAGVIAAEQEQVIQNILSIGDRRARDIMTPRTVVFSLEAGLTLRAAHQQGGLWPHSRVPLYSGDRENIVGLVLRRDLLSALAAGRGELELSALKRPISSVPEQARVNRLLEEFLRGRQHLFAVYDEYGGFAGIVTLEDVLEEIVGREIVDESDAAVDMQEQARLRHRRLFRPPERE